VLILSLFPPFTTIFIHFIQRSMPRTKKGDGKTEKKTKTTGGKRYVVITVHSAMATTELKSVCLPRHVLFAGIFSGKLKPCMLFRNNDDFEIFGVTEYFERWIHHRDFIFLCISIYSESPNISKQ
jgi:hypothetical protein